MKIKKLKKTFRFSDLCDNYMNIDDLVEKVMGNPYIDIKAINQEDAELKFKLKHPIIIKYKIKQLI